MGCFYNRKSCAAADLFQSNSQTLVQFRKETAHRFPSNFWAGLATLLADPTEVLHPIDLHRQQSLLAHAVRGLGQVGGCLGDNCCSHQVEYKVSWAHWWVISLYHMLTCLSCVCLVSAQHSAHSYPAAAWHWPCNWSDCCSVWPEDIRVWQILKLWGVIMLPEAAYSIQHCFATPCQSGGEGLVYGNHSLLDCLDPGHPSQVPC